MNALTTRDFGGRTKPQVEKSYLGHPAGNPPCTVQAFPDPYTELVLAGYGLPEDLMEAEPPQQTRSCGRGGASSTGDWCPPGDACNQGSGGNGSGYTIGPIKTTMGARKPVVCSAKDLIFGSLEFSFKMGLEANVGNFAKIGGSFFRNLTTGTTGASAGVKAIVGYEVGTENPPGVPITTPAAPVTQTVALGPFQRNLTTKENSVKFSVGLTVGIGGEIAFNPKKFNELISPCDIIVD